MNEQEKAMWSAVFGAEYVRLSNGGVSNLDSELVFQLAVLAADGAIRIGRRLTVNGGSWDDRFTRGVPE